MKNNSIVYVFTCCALTLGLALTIPQSASAKDLCRGNFKKAKGKMRKYAKTMDKAIPKIVNTEGKRIEKFEKSKDKKDNKIIKFGQKKIQPHVEPNGNQCFVAGYNVEIDDGNGGTKCNPTAPDTRNDVPATLCGKTNNLSVRNAKKCRDNDDREYSPLNTQKQIARNCNKGRGNADDFNTHCQFLIDNSCNDTCESAGFALVAEHEACADI